MKYYLFEWCKSIYNVFHTLLNTMKLPSMVQGYHLYGISITLITFKQLNGFLIKLCKHE